MAILNALSKALLGVLCLSILSVSGQLCPLTLGDCLFEPFLTDRSCLIDHDASHDVTHHSR